MKIKREALQAAAEKVVRERAEHHQERESVYVEQRNLEIVKWRDEWAPQWETSVKRIQRKLRDGQVIYPDDLPREPRGFAGDRVAFGPRPYKPVDLKPLDHLPELIELLTCVDDEYVTSNALKDLGFTTSRIQKALKELSCEMRRV